MTDTKSMVELIKENQDIRDKLYLNRKRIREKQLEIKKKKLDLDWSKFIHMSRKKFCFAKVDSQYLDISEIIKISRYLEDCIFKDFKVMKTIVVNNMVYVKLNRNFKYDILDLGFDDIKLKQVNPNKLLN